MFDGKVVRQAITNLFSILHTFKKTWGDRTDSGVDLSNWVLTQFECPLEVVRKKKGQRGFSTFYLTAGWSREHSPGWVDGVDWV